MPSAPMADHAVRANERHPLDVRHFIDGAHKHTGKGRWLDETLTRQPLFHRTFVPYTVQFALLRNTQPIATLHARIHLHPHSSRRPGMDENQLTKK